MWWSGSPCDVQWSSSDPSWRECSFSKFSVTSPTSQLILQPFTRFAYVTANSPTLPLLLLRHSSFSNPSFASPTSQDFHLHHLASRPCHREQNQKLSFVLRTRDWGRRVVNRTGPNANAEVIAFQLNIDEALRTQIGSFFFFEHKENGGHRSFSQTMESISSQWWRYNGFMFL